MRSNGGFLGQRHDSGEPTYQEGGLPVEAQRRPESTLWGKYSNNTRILKSRSLRRPVAHPFIAGDHT